MINLRPYQTEANEAFMAAVARGQKRNMIVLPTGCGKTVTGLALAKQIGGRTLWIAHREELISQPVKALRTVWPEVNAGVVKAERNEWARDFIFASVQTAWRPQRLEKLTNFDFVVVDEAHHAAAKSYKLVLEQVGCFDPGGPPLLGLTATPERSDVLKLDDVFDGIVYQFQLRQAVESGYLVDVEMIQRPINVDLDKVGSKGGDFKEGELDVALLEAGIVGDVCSAVNEHARDRKTIIFTVSVRQAKQISERLQGEGFAADWISGETPTPLRRQRLAKLARGQITHMVNCMVLTEGFDDPAVDCIIMARPTQAKSLYVQCVGRGLRIAPNKDRCVIVDMVGMSTKHTLIQAPVIFGIDGGLDDTREPSMSPEEELRLSHRQGLLLSQIQGVAPVVRSKLRWIPARNGTLVLNCGEGGNVMMRPDGKGDWMVEVVGRKDNPGRELLTMEPVDIELAQGIAEDYVRRAQAVYLTSKSARWRDAPASDKQKEGLRKWGIQFHSDITKGEASDLMTQAAASSWKNDPATAKQMRALRRIGADFNDQTITKGEATRALNEARR